MMIRATLTLSLLATALAVCLLTAGPSRGQDEQPQRIEGEKAAEVAKAVAAAVAKLDLPVKATLDGKSGAGLHAGKSGAFIMPDTKLTAEALKKHDKGVLPLGVLVTTDTVTLVSGDKAVPAKDHVTAEVTVGDKTMTVNVVTLAAARVADRLVLLAYAKGKTPVAVSELNEDGEKGEAGLDLDGRKAGDNRATLVVKVLGKYKGSVQVAAKED
jgi:hypothetical protein